MSNVFNLFKKVDLEVPQYNIGLGDEICAADRYTNVCKVHFVFIGEGEMIVIGQICEIYKDDKYPLINQGYINKPLKEKNEIIDYMRKCEITAAAPAVITDVLNPENKIGGLYMMDDAVYAWRSDVIYYVEKYDMELPSEFIQYVLEQKAKHYVNIIKSLTE